MQTFIDPVCGMTVGESALRADGYEDVAFCGPGCRATFLKDPAAFESEAAAAPTEPNEGAHEHDH